MRSGKINVCDKHIQLITEFASKIAGAVRGFCYFRLVLHTPIYHTINVNAVRLG